MAQLAPSEQLTYNTVRLECHLGSGGTSTGTAFFFTFLQDGQRGIPTLITNKHVVAGAETATFYLHLLAPDGGPMRGSKAPVILDHFEQLWIPHPDAKVDLCAMPVAPLLRVAGANDIKPYFVSLDASLIPSSKDFDDLTALEDVVMIGYPIGIWDSQNNMPIIRKGRFCAGSPLKWS